MSSTPYFFVEKYDLKEDKYKLMHPKVLSYNGKEWETADLFPYNGCHDLFSIVLGRAGNSFPELQGIHQGLPPNVCPEIQKEYDDLTYEQEFEITKEKKVITPNAHWITYADLYIYYLKHPETIDYDAMDNALWKAKDNETVEEIMGPNPIKTLLDRVNTFMNVMEAWDWSNDYSFIRIVYWVL